VLLYTRTSSRGSALRDAATPIDLANAGAEICQILLREASGNNLARGGDEGCVSASQREAGGQLSIKETERMLQACGWTRSEAKHDAPPLWRQRNTHV
jgi:hypothetical protein